MLALAALERADCVTAEACPLCERILCQSGPLTQLTQLGAERYIVFDDHRAPVSRRPGVPQYYLYRDDSTQPRYIHGCSVCSSVCALWMFAAPTIPQTR